MSAVGVCFCQGSQCHGILWPVDNDDELKVLDIREEGYTRVLLRRDDIRKDGLAESVYADDEVMRPLTEDEIQIWACVPDDPKPASSTHPVAQTYVDTILRGCLSYSKDFATSFLSETAGWNEHWADDRHDPIYSRGDPDYSRAKGAQLDRLISDVFSEQGKYLSLEARRQYDRSPP